MSWLIVGTLKPLKQFFEKVYQIQDAGTYIGNSTLVKTLLLNLYSKRGGMPSF
jgi:hypothetical protein